MGRNLTNLYVSQSFEYLLQKSGSIVTDGLGNVIGTLDLNVLTANNAATADLAQQALFATSSLSASYSTTSSLPLEGFINVTQAGSDFTFVKGNGDEVTVTAIVSGSVENAVSASYALKADALKVLSNPTQNSELYVSFVTVDQGQDFISTDSTLRYNPGTNTLSATTFNGNLLGSVSNATSASYVSGSNVDGAVDLATTASYVAIANSATTALTASYVAGANVDGAVELSNTASYVAGANVDGAVANATNAVSSSYSVSASYALFAENANNSVMSEETDKVTIAVQSAHGATIFKGTPIHITGASGNTSLVVPASASNAATMPAHGALAQDLAPAQEGTAIINGLITGVNTTGFTSGETIYVAPNGGYTDIRPSGQGNLVQNLGVVQRIDITNGSGELFGAGRANDVPNPGVGNIFVGDTNGDPITISTGSLNVGSANSASYVLGSNVDGQVSSAAQADLSSTASYVAGGNVDGQVSSAALASTASYVAGANVDGTVANATNATNAVNAQTASIVTDSTIAYQNQNNNFTGLQTFNDISVNGTGSFAYIQSVTGSAKIIGDAFIILNNNTPSERYAGLKVIDSGSTGVTSSYQYDGSTDDWFFEKDVLGSAEYGVALFGPEYSVKGTPTYPTNNKIQKGNGGHHILDSSITDNGSLVSIESNTQITGSLNVSAGIVGNVTGNLTGNADTATSASHALQSDNAISASFATFANSTTSASYAEAANSFTDGVKVLNNGYLTENFTAPALNNEVGLINVTGATISGKAYNRAFFGMADYSGFGPQFEDYFSIEYYDSLAYNFGSELDVNGKQAQFITVASGSGQQSFVRTTDNYDGTSQTTISSGFKTRIIGGQIQLNGNTQLTGSLDVSAGIVGSLTGNATSATTASYILGSNVDGTVASATSALSASYAPTNTADNITWTGNQIFSGSSRGEVGALAIASLTASIDASTSNYFTLGLVSGSNTYIDVTNTLPGQTYILRATQPSTAIDSFGTISFAPEFKFAAATPPVATAVSGAVDVLTFVSFDPTDVYVTAIQNLS